MSSPLNNLNKGYAKQEKSDLMNDNPIASRASVGSFMSQHTQSGMGGSPLMNKLGRKQIKEQKTREQIADNDINMKDWRRKRIKLAKTQIQIKALEANSPKDSK
jgi:hypothetical protein|tara:strand:+ start:251 stop:562 length:312 start_codon:yes stop_codon:yes gene_type:complete